MTVPSIVHPLYSSRLPCGSGSASVPCARLSTLRSLELQLPFSTVSESGRFICGGGLGRLSGRHSSIDGWFCVWSAQFQPAGAWTSSDSFGLSRLHEERAYGPFKGDLSFVGLGAQLLVLPSPACEVIAIALCPYGFHSGALSLGWVYHFS